MAKIIIHRKKDWINATKVYEVFLDEQKLGYLSNGDTTEFEVPAGQHKLRVKMGWSGSNNLEYNVFNKDYRSYVVSINYIIVIVFIVLMTGAYYLQNILMKTHNDERIYSYLVLIFIILGAIFGRNTYLKLKEVIK